MDWREFNKQHGIERDAAGTVTTTPKTPDLAAVVRCDYTKNPCGSDTYRVGNPCNCLPCRGFAYGYDRAQADLAALRAERDRLQGELERFGGIGTIDALRHETMLGLIQENARLEKDNAAMRERLAVLMAGSDRLQAGLPVVYAKSTQFACAIAELCDEYLDRSGALLGRVRDAARTPGGNHEAE